MRDKVTRQCPQTTTFEKNGEPKRNRTEVLLLTSLTPYRWAKPAHYRHPNHGHIFSPFLPLSLSFVVFRKITTLKSLKIIYYFTNYTIIIIIIMIININANSDRFAVLGNR